jgi:4-amino-4-deoxy-L-arabinose transferase-like glycosyltransferase
LQNPESTEPEHPLQLSARSKKLVLILLLAGLALRLYYVFLPVTFDDDTTAYAQLATNWFHHGVYGFDSDTPNAPPDPSLIRLPGYPLFLGVIFSIFGQHLVPVRLIQVVIDLLGCLLIAQVARKCISERAGLITLALAALCPFTASYSASALTESLSVFCVSLAIFSTVYLLEAIQQPASERPRWPLLLLVFALAYAILLRPDGALLAFAVCTGLLWYTRKTIGLYRSLRLTALISLLTILPLIPWTIRNWRTFHVIQPLAPRRVNNPGEFVAYGFYNWLRTWSTEFTTTCNVYWQAGENSIDIANLPPRAFDSPQQYAQTRALLADYNRDHTLTPAIDARFQQLATARIAAHPFRTYVTVPLLRIADMWLRPRTEIFNIDAWFWRFSIHPFDSILAIALGLLNLCYLFAAAAGFFHHSTPIRIILLLYLLARCALLGSMENPEPRYTLEAFPIVCICAGAALASRRSPSRA